MPTTINDKLVSWASDLDPGTVRQAEKTARLPIVEGHVALMPDALVDEIPSAYKDIDRVMADQADLVEVRHTLRQVLNFKGT